MIGKGDSLGIVQEIELWPLYQTKIRPKEWNA